MTTIEVHAFTDVGLCRDRNEDAILVGGWLSRTHTGTLTSIRVEVTAPTLCAVADGMGGHAGGHLASNLALNILSTLGGTCSASDEIGAALAYVNDQIRGVGADPELHGLGTTIAGLSITATAIIAFNVGDSRIYSIDGGFLEQISVDDSVHDQYGRTSNLITQSLGQPTPVDPHIIELPLKAGSYLICSDGVSAVMPAAGLRAAVLNADLAVCAAAVIESTRENGATDNFSFLLVEVADVPELAAPAEEVAAVQESVDRSVENLDSRSPVLEEFDVQH